MEYQRACASAAFKACVMCCRHRCHFHRPRDHRIQPCLAPRQLHPAAPSCQASQPLSPPACCRLHPRHGYGAAAPAPAAEGWHWQAAVQWLPARLHCWRYSPEAPAVKAQPHAISGLDEHAVLRPSIPRRRCGGFSWWLPAWLQCWRCSPGTVTIH